MIRIKAAFALLAALALAACYPPTTSHPIGSSAGLKPDPALTGVWKGVDNDGKAHYVHFLHQSDGTLTILIVDVGPQAEDYTPVTATAARLGGNRLLNARLLPTSDKPQDDIPGTVPVLYRFDAKGGLTMALMDEHRVKVAVAAGRIKGTVEKGEMGDVVITAEPRALDAFMARPDTAALFAAPLFTLHRVE